MNHHNQNRVIHSELSIQNLLFERLTERQHQFIFPNVHMAFWEADLISVTRAGYVHEYEIKLSRSDYKADFNKLTKHLFLQTVRTPYAESTIPVCFWYVAPEGIIDFVPSYAGLIEVYHCEGRLGGRDGLVTIVTAPRLHSTKISHAQKDKIYRSAQWKLWNARKAVERTKLQRTLFKNIMREI